LVRPSRWRYVDQSREALDGSKTVFQEISGGQETLEFGKHQVNARAYAASFGFRAPISRRRWAGLSGGERNRLHLAKLLKSGGNACCSTSRPTTWTWTRCALEDALLRFAGCVGRGEHDRWFLDRIATHILAFEGDGEVYWYEGDYQGYAADFKRRKGASADQPHRIHYKEAVH